MKRINARPAVIAGTVTLVAAACLSPIGGALAQEPALPGLEQVAAAEDTARQRMEAGQEEVRSALQQVKAAEMELNQARISADQPRIEQAQSAYDQAVAEANAAIGRDGVDVGAMRVDGLGWGEIAHAAGLHPAALAFGRHKQQAHARGPVRIEPAPEEQPSVPDQEPGEAGKDKRAGRAGIEKGKTVSADKFAHKAKQRSELSGDNGLSGGGFGHGGNKGGHGKGHGGGGKGGNGNGGGGGNGGGNGGGGKG